ncbi:hypothetical protein M9Y10_028870 [Tritrichomonas musculus]|uniref:Exostosin GT47 domain-containing protein n=1 Tax=Tritrichomonas musculus TaxID=1915356 RepID=A0ABR2KNV1_9EUKA
MNYIGTSFLLLLSACLFTYRFIFDHHESFLMNLFQVDNPVGGKKLQIYLQEIDSKWNSDVINCTGCSCKFDFLDSLEPLIHCIIQKSSFVTKSIKDSTFIFTPLYTNNLRKAGINASLFDITGKDDSFSRWRGSRHIQVDSYLSQNENPNYMKFESSKDDKIVDQHVFITTNLTIETIRSNRWLNSRHILIPPLQTRDKYPEIKKKARTFLFLGSSDLIKKLYQKHENSLLIESFSDTKKVLDEVSESEFTVIHPNKDFLPFFIYEILRSYSIPVLLSGPFLPAFANTHINYTKVSIRINPENANPSDFDERIQKFDKLDALQEIFKVKKFLMWPKNGIASENNAGGVLLDYLNTRHRVLRPVLRRTFIGSDTFI